MEKQGADGIKLPNGWEAVSVIGRGSTGTVYRAKRVIGRNTEWAAVKHISMPANQDDLDMIRTELGTADEDTINAYLYESLQDMLGEYFRMKSLQGNTNIVACQDIQQIPKAEGIGYDVYIWMELLDSLSKRIVDGRMDRSETIRMGMDICQALSLLRSGGIVHRDIKPQNIFVSSRGDYKLGDFGSARGIRGTSTIMTMKGTFSYMAPEIMQGRPASFTSDIYSLGLVMYRLLNRNRHPFMQEGEISSARGIEESNLRRLGGEALPVPVDADEELGRIILKACAFEPRNRWQTAEEMYNALAALGEETVKKVFSFDRQSVTDQSNNDPSASLRSQPIPILPSEPVLPLQPQLVSPSPSQPVQTLPLEPSPPSAPVPQLVPALPPEPSRESSHSVNEKKLWWFIAALAGIVLLAAVLIECVRAYRVKEYPAQEVSSVSTSDSATMPIAKTTLSIETAAKANRNTIAAGHFHIAGLKTDGTVVAIGDNGFGQCNVDHWTDIEAIAAGSNHTVGLRTDGTVVAAGDNRVGQCNVSEWTDIVAITTGDNHTVGLRGDGTVVAVGDNSFGQCNLVVWKDIVSIAAGWSHTVGLKADGTVVERGDNTADQGNVAAWTDIKAIAACNLHTVGLKEDGTVVTTGSSGSDVSYWKDIVAIAAGDHHTVGLRADGTAVAAGTAWTNLSGWTDIVAIAAGGYQTVGLKADGTVVAVGRSSHSSVDVSDWRSIRLPES